MIMHKVTEEMEKGLRPDPVVIEAVGQLIGDAVKQRIFHGGEGLHPTSTRKHIAYKAGKRTITDGPFTEAKELVAGFAVMRVRSIEEAIGWCDRFANVIGDVQLYLGPVVESWDLDGSPRPADAPLRVLSMHQQDERAELDTPPTAEEMAKMGALIEEMTKAGVLESTGGLGSTKKGARIHFDGSKRTVIDGPFAESKELVAGFAILELPSMVAAIEWATRFGEIVRVHEVEVRQIPEW
ncbi:MAG TPA: YciI family protein [Nannocystaceae bacterium]|nr:YciI family protein [Nannocystaceae bacterium]